MPSASGVKTEKAEKGDKPNLTESSDNSPVRQIMTIMEHKIRNLEKRKGKLMSYRDLQKSGKELNADQKVAVAKYDEVAQTLEYARELAKQASSIVAAAEREAKKQAKKEAWMRATNETAKIREALLIVDCLTLMGQAGARDDFLAGANGAAKLSEADLQILDDLYPEVTPRHEPGEDGLPAFPSHATRAAEHLHAIIEGKHKDVLGTTYTRLNQIIRTIHDCGYFDRTPAPELQEEAEAPEELEPEEEPVEEPPAPAYIPPTPAPPPPASVQIPAEPVPVPPVPAVVPAPAYPLRPLAPITLQEVEHAYFAQQYPQQRISDVIGNQNFFFLQESEIDSPVGTPQPPIAAQPSPPGQIPTQTFTNQSYVGVSRVAPEPAALPIPQGHFTASPEHVAYPVPGGVHLVARIAEYAPPAPAPAPAPLKAQPAPVMMAPMSQPVAVTVAHHTMPPPPAPAPAPMSHPAQPPAVPQLAPHSENNSYSDESSENNETKNEEEKWQSTQEFAGSSQDFGNSNQEEKSDLKSQGQGDGQGRYRRYTRGPRGQSNGYRGRGAYRQNDNYQARQNDYQNRQNDSYQGRQNDSYQHRQNDYSNRQNDFPNRQNESYSNRQNDSYSNRQNDSYSNRQNDSYNRQGKEYQGRYNDYQHRQNDNYYSRNGGDGNGQDGESRSRDRYDSSYQGGFKSRGRGGPRGGPGRGGGPRGPRPNASYSRRPHAATAAPAE